MAATEPRTPSELVSLLLELARVVKARRYFEPGDPRLGPVFEHTRRAWAADLRRHGPLEVSLEDRQLEQGGESVPIDGRLEGELADWGERGVWRLRVEADADAEAFAGLVEVLAMPQDAITREGGAGPALARRVPEGVRIEAPEDAPGLPLLKDTGPSEDDGDDTDAFGTSADSELPAPDLARSGSDTEPLPIRPLPPSIRSRETSEEETEPVGLRLGASASSSDGPSANPSDLAAALLREIETAPDGAVYLELVESLVRLVEAESTPLGMAAVSRILAALASECVAKREDPERAAARDAIEQLCADDVLDAILDQAAEGGAAGERAAGVLAQLGEQAGLALAVRALTETNPERAARLADRWLGRDPGATAGPIFEALASPDRGIALRAIELAARLRSDEAIARLADALRSQDEFVREASARALAHCASPAGGDDAQALRALARGLHAPDAHVSILCTQCLGETRSPRAVPLLAEALRAAVDGRDLKTAKERIRALGDLGRPEGARELGAILLRKSLRGRRRLRELKLAAAQALARLPGDEAVGVLSQAAQLRDTQVREAAQLALERRSGAAGSG